MKSVKQATYLTFCVVVGVLLEVLPELSLATAVAVHKEDQNDLSIHTDPDLLHSFRILCLSIGLTMANFTFAS